MFRINKNFLKTLFDEFDELKKRNVFNMKIPLKNTLFKKFDLQVLREN